MIPAPMQHKKVMSHSDRDLYTEMMRAALRLPVPSGERLMHHAPLARACAAIADIVGFSTHEWYAQTGETAALAAAGTRTHFPRIFLRDNEVALLRAVS